MTSLPITVAIVEDDEEVRASLAQLLDGSDGFRCAQKLGDVETALRELPLAPPNVVLMDVNLPGLSGVEGVRQLRQRLPATQAIMLTVYDDEARIFEALAAGANGYLLKRTPAHKLLDAIVEVHGGGSPMSSYIARRVTEFFQRSAQPAISRPGMAGLSPREQEILDHLARGYRHKEIAAALHISLDTVRTHLRRVYEKLQVNSATEAVSRFLRR
jgi:DNA-binding NarL/FixJ family response regulator